MTELSAKDEVVTAEWYRRLFGFNIEQHDVNRSFILIQQGERRLAFKRSLSVDPSAILHFQVENLEAAIHRIVSLGTVIVDGMKSSDEGYRRVKFTDPDGRSVVVFEWNRVKSLTDITSAPSV